MTLYKSNGVGLREFQHTDCFLYLSSSHFASVTSRALAWCWRHERMLGGEKLSSFLCATMRIVCPLRWRFLYYISSKVSISFIATLYILISKTCVDVHFHCNYNKSSQKHKNVFCYFQLLVLAQNYSVYIGKRLYIAWECPWEQDVYKYMCLGLKDSNIKK